MAETYLTLEEAAAFEGISYEAMKKRAQRAPKQHKAKNQPTENGGRPQVLVAASSLSVKGRKAWRAAQKAEGREILINKRTEEAPWYVTVDYTAYVAGHEKAFYEAVELARHIQDFLEYDGPDRTGYAEKFAVGLGVSAQTLYRYTQNLLEANAWAMKLEQEDGKNREYFRPLSLCRKPREKDTFPALTEEQKAIIENIWFNKDFSENKPMVTLLYEKFQEQAEARDWESCPSLKTVGRYVKYLMDLPPAKSAHYLSSRGDKAWENAMQVKGKRTTSTLEVLEYVVADAHTFDAWVEYTTPNGKIKAIRPVLVVWEDMKTRRMLGPILCEHSNTQIVKESFIKMCYESGGVPMHVHMDNGKDFANREMLGQDRNSRAMEQKAMDAELKGFYQAMGAKKWSRSLPFHPWDKPIERAFRTFCMRFSKKFRSYTGTLTGSKTEDKVEKDVERMLERGELLTMAEFYDLLIQFLTEWYDNHEHDGLKEAGERWVTPRELWENAPHYEKAVPPKEYALMLLMKSGRAKVNSQGIRRFNTLYTAEELALYNQKWVNIRWDPEDLTKLYVYDKDGGKVCEARRAELLEFGDRVDEAALEDLHIRKHRNKKAVQGFLEEMRTPPEERAGTVSRTAVGKLDLTIGHAVRPKVVSLPDDKEFRAEAASQAEAIPTGRKKRSEAGDAFLAARGRAALEQLKAMGE